MTELETQYESMTPWMDGTRRFEAAQTNRLNSAHWRYAQDKSVNEWLSLELPTLRARAHYETRQNGMLGGVVNSHADDIVGQDGPALQVLSDNDAYNEALERVWRQWFAAPTPDPDVSGAELLRGWIVSLWKSGEYLCQIVTDPMAEGDVSLRIMPRHSRNLCTPSDFIGDPNVFMGIRFSSFKRPTQYYIFDEPVNGAALTLTFQVVPADLIIHRFMREETGQRRGVPWCNVALTPAADLRDYDDQVQDAARQIADQNGMLYTDRDDVPTHTAPESTDVSRRTWKTAPPGWKPFVYRAVQPPVQYPDYRSERQRDYGRHRGMSLATIRKDYSRYNYSSARLETQGEQRTIAALQSWISGTPHNTGDLNRLVDLIAAEARFTVPELRNRPERVTYEWTWPQRPHVDPVKEENADGTALQNQTTTLIDVLSKRGVDIEQHLAKIKRVQDAYEKAGLDLPQWASTEQAARAITDQVLDELRDGDLSELVAEVTERQSETGGGDGNMRELIGSVVEEMQANQVS